MDLQLYGKRAVVTGGSRGIGLAIVRALAEEGVHVVAASRTVSKELIELGDLVTPVEADLAVPDGARVLADYAGDLDILVNNVGGGDESQAMNAGFLDIDDAGWQRTYQLNLFATVRVTRALLPRLLDRGGGIIINISSVGARAAFPPVDYGTAKAALNNLTKALAEEFGSRGVRALTVTPGPTRTKHWSEPDGYAGQLARAAGIGLDDFLAAVPAQLGITTGRLTEPEEIAALVTFLASARSGNLTGADFLADGGVIKSL